MYANLSMQGPIESRAATLAAINKHVEILNADFKKKPESIDLSVLNQLLKQLEQANMEIEDRKKEIDSKFIGTTMGKWVSRGVVISMVALAVIAAITSFYVIAKINCGDSPAPKIAVGFNAASVALGTICSVFWVLITRQEDNLGNMQQEERFFKRFVAVYEDYRKTNEKDKAEDKFKDCIHSFNEIPEKEKKRFNIPAKAHWIELTTKILKEKNPKSELANKLETQMVNIANKSTEAQSAAFKSEQSGVHDNIIEPIFQTPP